MQRVIWMSVLSLAISSFVATGRTLGAEGDVEGVRKAAAEFYAALNSMFTGDASPMGEVWSHAEDITYMGPSNDGDYLVGWEKVREYWERQAAMKLKGKVEPEEMRITAGENLAVTHNYEKGTIYPNGKPLPVSIRVTNLFRKENGKWKMIGHHTDRLAFPEQ
ncbi:YybH family protein [Verrucomicrobiota bacterium sgz303538]